MRNLNPGHMMYLVPILIGISWAMAHEEPTSLVCPNTRALIAAAEGHGPSPEFVRHVAASYAQRYQSQWMQIAQAAGYRLHPDEIAKSQDANAVVDLLAIGTGDTAEEFELARQVAIDTLLDRLVMQIHRAQLRELYANRRMATIKATEGERGTAFIKRARALVSQELEHVFLPPNPEP